MRVERLLVAGALSLSLAVASPARADPAQVRARAAFDEGRAAFARRDFAAAAAAFEQAAELVPHPATWLNAAEAWEALGDAARAADDCERALAVPGIAPDVQREARSRLDRNAIKVATLDLRGAHGLAVRIDGEAAARPVPRRAHVVGGDHRLVVVDVSTGRSRTEPVFVASGDVRVVDLEPFGAAAPPSPPSPGPPLPALVAFGAAAAFGIVSAVFGVSTLDAKSEFDAAPTQEALDRFDRDRGITNVALVGAIVAAATGVVVWVVLRRSPPVRAAAYGALVF